MAKIIDFFDGAQTVTVPTIGNIQASSLSTYANDAAFESANGPGESGDVYINTTDNVIRYWNNDMSEWQSILSSSSAVDASNIADGSVSNTEFQYLDGVTSDIQPQLNDNASNIAQVASDLSDHENFYLAHTAAAIVNVPSGNLAATDVQVALDELQSDVDSRIPSSEKGSPSGVATLDGGGKVPASQLPNTVMELQGFWNANTNTPVLTDGVGNPGDIYEVDTAGTTDFGNGNITFAIGDWAVYAADNMWHKSINSNAVASVNSQTGNVLLDTDDIPEGTNLYHTDERAQDAVGSILQNTATINLSYNDGVPSIAAIVNDDSITNGILAEVPTATFKGRTTAGTGNPEDLTATQATALLNPFVGDSGAGGTKGLVPAPVIGDATKFLRGDGVFASVSGTGANTTLSNLTSPIAINQNFNFDLGAAATIKTKDDASTQNLTVTTGVASSTTSGNYSCGSGNATTTSGTAGMSTGSGTVTGALNFTTGNASAGNSGGINFTTGTSTATRGDITFTGRTLVFNATGTGTAFTGALSPSAHITYNLGAPAAAWNITYSRLVLGRGGAFACGSDFNTALTASFESGSSNGAANVAAVTVQSGSMLAGGTGTMAGVTVTSGSNANASNNNPTGNTVITTGTTNSSGGAATGSVTISTATPTGTNNPTGSINLTPGTPTGTGTRGKVNINGLMMKLPTGTADPTGVDNGDAYYNTSTDQLRVFNGGTWRGVTLT